MKRFLTVVTLAVSLVMANSVQNNLSAQVNVGVNITYQDFYDELSPHGEWMDYPEYGYVWRPSMGSDFQPYRTNGHWAWSEDYEWMWVSDYNWGWAPFHYGRWFMDPKYGWMWVPGYDWSPGWVAWRDGGDYYGWAPLRPGFNISIGFGNYNPPVDYWSFTPRRYISSHRIYDYCLPRQQNVTIINHTTIINNYGRRTNNIYVSNGPRRYDAERYTGRINPVRVRDINSPGRTRFRGNEVSIYRPNISRDNTRNFAPRNFERYDRNGVNNNNIGRRNENNLPERRDANNGTERGNDPRVRGNEIINRADRNREIVRNDAGNNAQGNNDRFRNRTQENPVDRNNTIDQPGRRRNERPGAVERSNRDVISPSENRRIDHRQRSEAPQTSQNRSFEPRQRPEAPQPSQNRSFEPRQRPEVQQPSQNRSFEQRESRSGNMNNTDNRRMERSSNNERRIESPSRPQQSNREPRQFENRSQGRGNEQRAGRRG